ncbi:hypothetical protein MKO06_03835 [Gramella sp. GC03-9]|uniref:Uncharacterized protein n=1 Tax=Christiangramia oceanisediminis TaxID=2920386 RepID=A0A9X2I1P6_9FLAO|nr:hypothetical protein [Gramella oceanisediminis]MCP9199025.1 hypothetical protein [Gramella oceanisediminis]
MKKQTFNSSELGMLSNAYLKELFPLPKRGELLSKCENSDCTLLFEINYHKKLYSVIVEKFNEGQFARSNAEIEWNNLMTKIGSAQITEAQGEDYDIYWLSKN